MEEGGLHSLAHFWNQEGEGKKKEGDAGRGGLRDFMLNMPTFDPKKERLGNPSVNYRARCCAADREVNECRLQFGRDVNPSPFPGSKSNRCRSVHPAKGFMEKIATVSSELERATPLSAARSYYQSCANPSTSSSTEQPSPAEFSPHVLRIQCPTPESFTYRPTRTKSPHVQRTLDPSRARRQLGRNI